MGGLWEEYDVMEVASPQAWVTDMDLVLRFYNERRKQLEKAEPNAGHLGLAELEQYFDVEIITQNVDNLHERAGSSKVLHLHGELTKVRSTLDPTLVYELDGWELKRGDTCEKGSQLRPHIVWFGESVPLIEDAAEITQQADAFAVIGSSLVVYPAAGLVDYVPSGVPIYLIDPNDIPIPRHREVDFIKEKGSTGLPILKEKLLNRFSL
jgi:NAD-dependent deacetylase